MSNGKNQKPVLALSMGDPAGIGPEIAVKALTDFHSDRYTVAVIGDAAVLRQAAGFVHSRARIREIDFPDQAADGTINVISLGMITPGEFVLGKAQASCGKAAYGYIIKAIDLAVARQVIGVVTNPINKEALKLAGIPYPGHTEILAERTRTGHYSMMFLLDRVGVAHVTTHCSVRTAIDLVRTDTVLDNIRLLASAMQPILGGQTPRIAVGGLNPHAGENGLFGDEELLHIAPAVELARKEGINASGPYPPDTVFMRAFKGEFDGVVAMLHDHGFVALKSRDFEHGVNITIGLPTIRTSVGHGTAFDLAGTGKASDESLRTAIEAAWKLWDGSKASTRNAS